MSSAVLARVARAALVPLLDRTVQYELPRAPEVSPVIHIPSRVG